MPLPKAPNKYRRAFDWRISRSADNATEFAAMSRLAKSELPDLLEDFLDISRRRKANWMALARLQISMLTELLLQESAVQHYREKLKELKSSQAAGASDTETEQHLKAVKRELFFYRMFANVIRSVGDGIAWRTLGYDRAVTRLMSGRQTKQWLTSEGLLRELTEWSLQFERGDGLAILNALTNCLAVGDITVVRPDQSVGIIEVKSSNAKSGRTVRQKQSMTEVVTLLATGAGHTEDGDVQIEILPVVPEAGLDRLGELLQNASEKGFAGSKISNCLYAEVFDFARIEDIEKPLEEAEKLRNTVVGAWEGRGDSILQMKSLDVLAFTPNCAPFSIYPFSSRTCIDLLIGSKVITTYLNHNAVGREFENHGWRVEQSPEELAEQGDKEAIMAIEKEGCHIRVPHADFTRLQMEALRVKTLVEA